MGWRQGYYEPKNPDKYIGKDRIVYRSSWELRMNQFLDSNPNILEWCSEPFPIKYIKPTDGKVHRYFPDYYVKYKNKGGKIIQEVWEVKPEEQTKMPRRVGKRKTQQLKETVTYAINKAKWESAVHFCNKYGLKFRLITENSLFKR